MKKARKGRGRPAQNEAAMQVTVPLRLSNEIIAGVDAVRAERDMATSRNAVLREAISKGLRQMLGGKGGK